MDRTEIVDRALITVGGDRELLEELSGIFLTESPAMLDAIREAIAARDAQSLDQAAHTFRGALATLGATEAAAAARMLEMSGRHNTFDDAPAALAQLEAQVAVVTQILAQFKAGPT
jgi:HPt (histidine-containing phosphotransfer) domain-containing protein